METKKVNPLFALWKMADEALDEVKMRRALKNLRGQAENDVLEAQNKLEDAEAKLEEAKRESKESKEFQKIVNASLAVKTARVKFKEAVSIYEDVFGVSPSVIQFEYDTE